MVLLEKTSAALRALSVTDPEGRLKDAVGLLDALLMHRVARAALCRAGRLLLGHRNNAG
jgi:hypothetical protein